MHCRLGRYDLKRMNADEATRDRKFLRGCSLHDCSASNLKTIPLKGAVWWCLPAGCEATFPKSALCGFKVSQTGTIIPAGAGLGQQQSEAATYLCRIRTVVETAGAFPMGWSNGNEAAQELCCVEQRLRSVVCDFGSRVGGTTFGYLCQDRGSAILILFPQRNLGLL
jgi:hypothetical protein